MSKNKLLRGQIEILFECDPAAPVQLAVYWDRNTNKVVSIGDGQAKMLAITIMLQDLTTARRDGIEMLEYPGADENYQVFFHVEPLLNFLDQMLYEIYAGC
jgi:hypothetical protein